MRKILFILSLLVGINAGASIPSIKEVRSLYQKAAIEKDSCIRLLSLLENCDRENALLLGYIACAKMIMAKHVLNPLKKLSFFMTGKQTLDNILYSNINNIELRYLRLTIQTNIPSFLKYRGDIDNDKQYLIQSLPNIQDEQLKILISAYLKQLHLNK